MTGTVKQFLGTKQDLNELVPFKNKIEKYYE